MINSFFDKIYCINLEKRKDRLEKCNQEFIKHRLNVDIFKAIDGNSYDTSNMFVNPTIEKGNVGCVLSHLKIIQDAQHKNYDKILILEDDIIFDNELNKKFEQYIKELPHDWDMLYFGGNHNFHTGHKLDMISEHIGKCKLTYTTHSYAIRNTFFQKVINKFQNITHPVDVLYTQLQSENNIYTFYPGISSQRSGYSDILNQDIDYSEYIK